MRFARSLAVWVFAAVYWAVAFPLYLLSLRNAVFFQRCARLWGRLSLRLAGVRLVLENESTLDDRRPRVVIINHQSGLDLIWAGAACPPAPLAIGKKEVIYLPIINVLWWALGFIRIDRRDTRAAIEKLRGVGTRIARERRSLMIAPEGTRTRDGSIGPFKKGAFHIASAAATPIYPIVVHGAFEVLPRDHFVFRPSTVRLRFLPPVPTGGWAELSHDDFAAKVEEVRARMVEALAEMGARAPQGGV